MRRAVPVVAATAGALALLLNFHTRPSVGGISAAPVSPLPSTTTAPPAPTTAPPSTGVPGAAGATAPPVTTTTAAPTRTIDGSTVSTDYGDVQVRVTFRGNTITDVQALKLPFDRSRSQRISADAGPILRSEALRAQSAHINAVSGASYTSAGYISSLQSAIDRSRA
ncbi:MAG: hypothetical protein JWL73_2629 [Actinomycetia bacterium]|nr:hypothetical protein [Actinomycetes bacterium]